MASKYQGFRSIAVGNSDNLYKDFCAAYDAAMPAWSQAWEEMRKDLAYVLGEQWDPRDEQYLKAQGRAALKFNKMMRCVKLVSGYQRKNRLSLKVDPVEGSDEATAEQLTAIMLWLFSQNQYYLTLSDAFEAGPLISGINLIHIGMDYSDDIVNGDPQLYRMPYHQFLLDPTFTRRDLSDCDYAIVRLTPDKERAKVLLPFIDPADIDELKPGLDNRFMHMSSWLDSRNRERLNMYYFWHRTTKPVWVIVDKMTGRMFETEQSVQQVNRALELAYIVHGDRFDKVRRQRPVVELDIVLQEQVVYHGPDPTGIESEFPLVPLIGTYLPEHEKWSTKIQGLARQLRDPQTEKNRRMSQMLDIIESQINTGFKAKPRAVIDKESLYRTGQGRVIWMTDEADMTDVEQLRPVDVPQSHFQLQEILDREIPEIANINAEMFGAPENENLQVAGVLAKMRMAAGLVGLQEYFDHYRFAKQTIGMRIVEAIQRNWSPDKVARVTGQPPADAFYTRDFGRYDCVATEGLLTDTQRQMFYAELKALRAEGYAVPMSLIVDYMPIQLKAEVKRALLEAEQQQAQQAQRQQALDALTAEVMQATKAYQLAQAQERLTQAEENRATAALDRAKTAAEIQDIGAQRALDLLRLFVEAKDRFSQGIQGVMP